MTIMAVVMTEDTCELHYSRLFTSLYEYVRVPAADAKLSQVRIYDCVLFRGRSHHEVKDAMDETFLLSNIAPQVGAGFNRHCEK